MNYKNLLYWVLALAITLPFVAYLLFTVLPGFNAFIVSSGSMEPAIPTGSVIFTAKVNPSSLDVNDVITFTDRTTTTTHRIIDKRNNSGEIEFKTKGDANEAPDPGWVDEDRLIGKQVFNVPLMGKLLVRLQSVEGFIFFILIPSALLISYQLSVIWKELYGEESPGDLESIFPALGAAAALIVLSGTVFLLSSLTSSSFDYNDISLGIVALLVAAFISIALRFD